MLIYIALITGATAGIIDWNCTEPVGGIIKFSSKAVNCQDRLSSENCKLFYPMGANANSDVDRDKKCYENAAHAVDPQLVQRAVSTCPKTCGYCCITPAYNCKDKQNPRYPCSSVQPDMCTNNVWRSILAEDCPKTCGLCDVGDCTDTTPYCNAVASICHNTDLQDFVRTNCRKTCNLCNDSTKISSSISSIPCGSHPSCADWIRNNFCFSTFYTTAQKMQYCGKLCNLC